MSELDVGDAELQELATQQLNGGPRTALPATFYVEAVYDEAKSKTAGRPVYVDKDMIEIRLGVDILRHEVTADEKKTYAAQWLAHKKGENQEAVEGFPLAQWSTLPGKAIAKEFAHFGIRTVEQLAAATDATLQRIGPHMGLRQKARDWVADATKQGPMVKLRDENELLKSRVAALEQMVQRQTKDIEAARQNGGTLPAQAAPVPDFSAIIAEQVAKAVAAATPPPKKRGRPPKVKPPEINEGT